MRVGVGGRVCSSAWEDAKTGCPVIATGVSVPVPAHLCAGPPVPRATVFPGSWPEERHQPPQQRPGHAGLPSCCPSVPAVPPARPARAGPGSPAPSGATGSTFVWLSVCVPAFWANAQFNCTSHCVIPVQSCSKIPASTPFPFRSF